MVEYYKIVRTNDNVTITKTKFDNINRWDDTAKKFVDDNNSYTDSGATDSTIEYSYTIKACNDQEECSKDAGPAKATPIGGPAAALGDNRSSDTSSTPSSSSQTSSVSSDPGTVNLTVIQTGSGSVSLMHMGSLDGNDNGFDSNISGISPWGLGKNYIYKITATPSSAPILAVFLAAVAAIALAPLQWITTKQSR